MTRFQHTDDLTKTPAERRREFESQLEINKTGAEMTADDLRRKELSMPNQYRTGIAARRRKAEEREETRTDAELREAFNNLAESDFYTGHR